MRRLTPTGSSGTGGEITLAAAKVRIPVEQILEDLAQGAPRNPDGTMNLMHYTAWLLKEMGRAATDPRRLRPSELCRLLNSTPLGEVINERQLHRHRSRAGMRIGDGRHVDLLRYVAWLVQLRHEPKPRRRTIPTRL